jgi:hypothetical protein
MDRAILVYLGARAMIRITAMRENSTSQLRPRLHSVHRRSAYVAKSYRNLWRHEERNVATFPLVHCDLNFDQHNIIAADQGNLERRNL